MDVFLPKGFEAGISKARATRPMGEHKLFVEVDGLRYPVVRRWPTGFAVSASDVPLLQGIVTLYDGTENLGERLITKCETDEGRHIFRTKSASNFNYAAATEFEGTTQTG
jgi:hypothetical protein